MRRIGVGIRGVLVSLVLAALLERPALAAFQWVQRSTTGPAPRVSCGMVYDQARRQTVLFGGWGGSSFLGDTWTWDGTAWTEQLPPNSPLPRRNFSMAYDPDRERTVVFGGHDAAGNFQDLWEWDGATWTRENTGGGPAGRTDSGFGFDPSTGELLLFGGRIDQQYLEDTWAWDGSSWDRVATSGPSRRDFAELVADPVSHVLTLLFGRDPGAHFGDLWEWDGFRWRFITNAGTPPGRKGHRCVADTSRRSIVMVGGDNDQQRFSETWELSGSTWSLLTAAGPSGRGYHGFSYDTDRHTGVLFGGGDGNTFFGDTWEYVETDPTPTPFPPCLPEAPIATVLSPAPHSIGVAQWSPIRAHFRDLDPGVDLNSVHLEIEGVRMPVTFSGTIFELNATFVPTTPYPEGVRLGIRWEFCDLCPVPNCAKALVYSLTIDQPFTPTVTPSPTPGTGSDITMRLSAGFTQRRLTVDARFLNTTSGDSPPVTIWSLASIAGQFYFLLDFSASAHPIIPDQVVLPANFDVTAPLLDVPIAEPVTPPLSVEFLGALIDGGGALVGDLAAVTVVIN